MTLVLISRISQLSAIYTLCDRSITDSKALRQFTDELILQSQRAYKIFSLISLAAF